MLADDEQELEALIDSLRKPRTRYTMEISAEKTRQIQITNSSNGLKKGIKLKKRKLDAVTWFRYLGAVSQMVGHRRRISQGLNKLLRLLQK